MSRLSYAGSIKHRVLKEQGLVADSKETNLVQKTDEAQEQSASYRDVRLVGSFVVRARLSNSYTREASFHTLLFRSIPVGVQDKKEAKGPDNLG